MSWSVTVTDPGSYEHFDREITEQFNSENPAYPYDADIALEMVKRLGLKSATLSGGRTPIPSTDDEVVMVCITGTVKSSDFLQTIKDAIAEGPDAGTAMFEHYRALAYLHEFPCYHKFEPYDDGTYRRCTVCDVNYREGLLWFDE